MYLKSKSKEYRRKYMVMISLILFFIGNRFGSLYMQQDGSSIINRLIDALSGYLESFGTMGLKVGLDMFSFLFGFGAVLIGWCVYLYHLNTRQVNYRTGEEHGSGRIGQIETEAASLRDEEIQKNMIITKDIWISLDTRVTMLNDNILVIGGSGSGKTRFFVKPNLYQMQCNYIVTDPKFSLPKETANAFYKMGYDIKILNLIDMFKSMQWNPFKYFKKPVDILKFVNSLINCTTNELDRGGGEDGGFFTKAEISLISTLSFYIMACGSEEERNMNTVMDLLDLMEASEEDEGARSIFDLMMEELAEENKELHAKYGLDFKNSYRYLAERTYSLYKKAAGKTAKSILISIGVRLMNFTLPELQYLFGADTIDLETIGKPRKDKNGKYIKTILYVGISDSDSTFSFIASLMYQQLFEILYRQADERDDNRLPIHTRFILDEFANIARIPDFEKKIATMRSREISVSIILQNLAQLKNEYKDSWETIFGNCDTTLFLGGKEPSTTKYLSELIGNETVDYMSISETRGRDRSWSRSNQLIQRPLFEAAEISRLKNSEALVHIRGFNIFKDKKYPLENHPNIDLTTDCKDKYLAASNTFSDLKIQKLIKAMTAQYNEEADSEVRYEDSGLRDISNENVIYFKHKN